MAVKYGMPSLGHMMEKGRVIEWLKREGESLSKGEPLVVIETDQGVTEVEAPADGVLLRIVVLPDEECVIGATIAVLGNPGEHASAADLDQLLGDELAASTTPVAPVVPATSAPVAGDEGALNVSPMARKLAEEYGVDTSVIRGTGPGGQITQDDVLQVVQGARPMPAGSVPEEAIAALAPTSAPVETPAAPTVVPGLPLETLQTIPLSGMRGQVAERMVESWNTIPRVTEVMQIDMSASVAFHEAMIEQWEQEYGLRISLNDMITKAVAVALSRHPRLNATLVDREVRVHRQVNIGVAVNLDEGLMVPVVKDADQKGVGDIGRESRELAEKARVSRLQVDDLSEGTFTLTNLDATGIDLFTPMINPPQVAILGVGRIQRRPVVVEDALAIRPSAYFCLVFDHRAVDGLPAAYFLQELQQLLTKPQDYAL